MARDDADALVLAGWLSERGVCLERSTDKAWVYYERAVAAGDKKAGLRLAGLAATVEGGQDVAAVLWWGRSLPYDEGGSAGGPCDPLPERPEADETAFVNALKAWSQDKLEYCRAMVGWQGLVHAELRYPMRALYLGLQGSVDVSFRLHDGTFDLVPRDLDADSPLVERLRTSIQEALVRLPRPRVPVSANARYIFRIE